MPVLFLRTWSANNRHILLDLSQSADFELEQNAHVRDFVGLSAGEVILPRQC